MRAMLIIVPLLYVAVHVGASPAITFVPSSSPLVAGSSEFSLTCEGIDPMEVDFNEKPLNETQRIDYNAESYTKSGFTTIKLSVNPVTEDLGGNYSCNEKSTGLKSVTRVVVVSIHTVSKQGDENSTSLELSCSVNQAAADKIGFHFGNFLPWSRGGVVLTNETEGGRYAASITGLETTLNISKLNASSSGEYVCSVEVHIDGHLTNVSQIAKVLWSPHIEPFAKPRSRVEDETAELECLVSGYPIPNVTWFLQRDESNVAQVPVRYEPDRVVATRGRKGVGAHDAHLTIKGLRIDKDRGTYMCVATNELGSSNATVSLKVKDKLAAVWPFLGICAEVAILCSIIFIFEKRRNKKLEEEEEVEAVKQELLNNPGRENEDNKDSTEMRKRPVKA